MSAFEWLRGLLPSSWENYEMRAKSSTTVSIRLYVWVKEKDNAFLTALQFMNTRISMRWTCVGGWNALQTALVCTITRDAAWEIVLRLTSQLWNNARVEKYRANMWPLTEAYGWHNCHDSPDFCQSHSRVQWAGEGERWGSTWNHVKSKSVTNNGS